MTTWQAVRATRAKTDADQAKTKAIAAQKQAEEEKAKASHLLYAANMNLAQQAWEQNNIGQLRQLLEETQDSPYCGFEWYFWQQQTHLDLSLKTLRGHLDVVTSVAFSPDGQRVVTGSLDNEAKVWEAASGRELLKLKGHSDGVNSVAFSPDGQRIVTGSLDNEAKVWEAASGKELFTLKAHGLGVRSVAFSPDGQRIVTGGGIAYPVAKVWDAVNGRELLTLKGHSGRLSSVAFSPDGQRIVTGSDDHTAKVWEAASGKELLTLKGHAAGILAVAYSPDGQRIVTGSWDQTAKVWEAASGQPADETSRSQLTLKGHSIGVFGVAFSPDEGGLAMTEAQQLAQHLVYGLGGEVEKARAALQKTSLPAERQTGVMRDLQERVLPFLKRPLADLQAQFFTNPRFICECRRSFVLGLFTFVWFFVVPVPGLLVFIVPGGYRIWTSLSSVLLFAATALGLVLAAGILSLVLEWWEKNRLIGQGLVASIEAQYRSFQSLATQPGKLAPVEAAHLYAMFTDVQTYFDQRSYAYARRALGRIRQTLKAAAGLENAVGDSPRSVGPTPGLGPG